jgi:hypothetical protein
LGLFVVGSLQDSYGLRLVLRLHYTRLAKNGDSLDK